MGQKPFIEALYDRHSSMLYSIALQISPTQSGAEEILIRTFQKIDQQAMFRDHHPADCANLIKLVIQTAIEYLGANVTANNFKIKQFEDTPILHKLLCEQMSLDNYCDENGIGRAEVTKIFRQEFAQIRKLKVSQHYEDKFKYG
ncbi:MAG: hypothetical protein IPN76_28145 [Saprospiraceae bacterium]|nr:hypothetical protein [Saprospiraceae bacterium]